MMKKKIPRFGNDSYVEDIKNLLIESSKVNRKNLEKKLLELVKSNSHLNKSK